MRVLTLTKYGPLGASSRMRTLQFLPYLCGLGWTVEVAPFLDDSYVRSLYGGHPLWRHATNAYVRRLRKLGGVAGFDVVWIEKDVPAALRGKGFQHSITMHKQNSTNRHCLQGGR